jgi:hypothetical protein
VQIYVVKMFRPPCSLAHDPNFPEFADQQENCSDNYEFNYTWWIVLSFRLSFVLLFGVILFYKYLYYKCLTSFQQLVVLSIKAIFAYIIPDMPTKIIKQLQRERFLVAVHFEWRTFFNPFFPFRCAKPFCCVAIRWTAWSAAAAAIVVEWKCPGEATSTPWTGAHSHRANPLIGITAKASPSQTHGRGEHIPCTIHIPICPDKYPSNSYIVHYIGSLLGTILLSIN